MHNTTTAYTKNVAEYTEDGPKKWMMSDYTIQAMLVGTSLSIGQEPAAVHTM